MEITIVGSGHGGCAMAAVQAMHGNKVNIIKLSSAIHNENFSALQRDSKIRLSGKEGQGEFALAKVTNDPAEAIPEAELILVYYVSNFHSMVAERLAPHLHRNQCVVLNPGYAGSLLFEKAMKAAGNDSLPLFAEFETLPYSSRIDQPGSVSDRFAQRSPPVRRLPCEPLPRIRPAFLGGTGGVSLPANTCSKSPCTTPTSSFTPPEC